MSKVTIIITAHNRKKYLPYAINSIFSALDPKSIKDLEIVVVKNFKDDNIDSWLDLHNVKNIVTSEESLAQKQAIGISNAHGDLIAFLEDDDMFALNKIYVLRKLLNYSDLDFFHNLFMPIEEATHESQIVPFNDYDVEFFHVDNLRNNKILKYIIRTYHPEIYNSCTTISKDLAMKCIDGLKRVDINTERFWFLCTLEKGRRIALTKSPLTLYRVHEQSYSQPNSNLFSVGLLERYIRSYTFMLEYFQKETVRRIVEEQYKLHLAHYLIYDRDNITRKLKLALFLLSNSLKPSAIYNEYSLLSAVSLLSSLMSTSLAKRILYR
ncbi:glycosyltransferase family 2 protein [Saccharolobus islandicus]|uniref:glycosyltransferase family 2 protein n=1 Tax=Saccharolobus islandicus TaxID=43080 RepID=UPI00037C0F2C|nr:glycosyltransferase family 2 protein [Sulfolobus islandicus]